MIDHVTIYVRDVARARAQYAAALEPIGYEVLRELPGAVGLGARGKPDLWLALDGGKGRPQHVAVVAGSRAEVDAFHAAALAVGLLDNGKPGLREQYHAAYYGAFVTDENGHNLEAVCHKIL